MTNTSKPIKTDLVTYEVKSNGKPIDPAWQVNAIRVERAINQIAHCEIEILDGSAAHEDFLASDSEAFVPGTQIDVLAGYENDNKLLFRGIVTNQNIRVSWETGSVLVVTIKDEAIRMTVGRQNACFVKKKDSEVMSQLINNHGLSSDITATTHQLPEIIQYYATDWDFMVARADVNGMVVMTVDGKVSVKRPEDVSRASYEVTYGKDLLKFDGELHAVNQYKTVQSATWDYSRQQVTTHEASVANTAQGNLSSSQLAENIGLSRYDLQTPSSLSREELTSWSKAMATKSEYAKITGSASFQGSSHVAIGSLLELKEVGKRFAGKGFVSGVAHVIVNGSWVTTAHLGLTTEWFTAKVKTEAPMASGMLPGVQGLQVGKVKQIHDDPADEYRVLIELPLITHETNEVWARLSGLYASKGAGAFFFPEPGDEVIVGFLNDDPGSAIVLGALYSKSRPSPVRPDESNSVKSIVTREQMKVTFDEKKREIVITTPASNQIVFSDEEKGIQLKDQNDNVITTSAAGIDLKSHGSISLQSGKSVDIKGAMGVTLQSAVGKVELAGLAIQCKADQEFAATGAFSSVSAQAKLDLEGQLINMNGKVLKSGQS